MIGTDNVKTATGGETEEEKLMTSSRRSTCWRVSWPHLCVVYVLLGVYGLWAITSYQLIRTSLLDELESSLGSGTARLECLRQVRDGTGSGDAAPSDEVMRPRHETASVGRVRRDARGEFSVDRRRPERRRRVRDPPQRPSRTSQSDAEAQRRRRQRARSGRRRQRQYKTL